MARTESKKTALKTASLKTIALVAITSKGALMAEEICLALCENGQRAECHFFRPRLQDQIQKIQKEQKISITGFDDMASYLPLLFQTRVALVGFMPAAILIRLLSRHFDDKWSDSPLLAMDENFIQPLLGGHHGGHDFARLLADISGAQAIITNQGDRQIGFALDNPPAGWRMEGASKIKAVMAGLIDSEGSEAEKIIVANESLSATTFWPSDAFCTRLDVEKNAPLPPKAQIYVGVKKRQDAETLPRFYPPLLTVGIGCSRGAGLEEIAGLVEACLEESGYHPSAIAGIASIDLKKDEEGLIAFARLFDRPLRFFPASRLNDFSDQLSAPSEASLKATGAASVAEASALALAGEDAKLIMPKKKNKVATFALALAPRPLELETLAGEKRGRLTIAGLGPGEESFQTLQTRTALLQAEQIIGYSLYLDFIKSLAPQAELLPFAIGRERERCAKAIELAKEGQKTVLVCSGDPGVYAMASLVMELIENDTQAGQFDWDICPGISAMQLLAARIGAPLGHDFCAISLSDLLTSEEQIITRIRHAVAGDFVIAFYNPQSETRRKLLKKALAILKAGRSGESPIICGRNLGRTDETITVANLASFDETPVDMLSIVMVGNSQSRAFTKNGRKWVYTPRGYHEKTPESPEAPESLEKIRKIS